MSIEHTIEKLNKIEKDKIIENLIAQANARYILFNTLENRDNFPPYTIKDENLNILAFYYLNLGCTLAENKELEKAREPMEKGASILEYTHGSESNRQETSNYYGIVAALSYYVSFQYSKSFILIQKFQFNTVISTILSLFLKREYKSLAEEVNKIIINSSYRDSFITENMEETDCDLKIYEITIAKAIDGFVKYFQMGNDDLLQKAKDNLSSLKEIAELKSDPGIWWVIRLLLLISEGFHEASLWNSLRNYFDIRSNRVRRYIQSLVYQPSRGIYELFIAQRKSLSKVLNLDNNGCIVSIPTSSGKTRIAEIAILDCLIKKPDSKVLYIAPFRSLAFEVENSLGNILGNVDIFLSHLYGGSLFNKLDEKTVEEAQVIIATPEKSKAMLRGNKDILNQIQLIIIDEGHLLGPNKRMIVNEIFYEELRYFIEKTGGRFLLLSAVLPNAEELAEWLTFSQETVYKDKWRPSDERLGILEWAGDSVNLNWESNDTERASFNKRFIVSKQEPLKNRQRKIRYFPSNRNEAIAATAYKMRNFGPVLIFVGLKASVFVMAECYLKCLGHAPEDFKWKNINDWKAFELACTEAYGNDNNWLLYARKGILCHNSDLHTDVRLPLERLMRYDRPLVVIATSTLGQGVNLGVSTVIFSTLYQGQKLISPRDFWNIAGRAGRAFVDHEGKILVALDSFDKSTIVARNKIKHMRQTISEYFDKEKIDIAKSGILILIKYLKNIASNNDVSFDLLIQLISENRTQDIGNDAEDVDEILDWIDDTLLSLNAMNNKTTDEIDYSWTEDFFRKSLACIQTSKEAVITGDQVLAFLKARIEGVVKKVGVSKIKWKSIIRSGIPLNSNLLIEEKLPEIIETIDKYNHLEKLIDNKIELLKSIEKIIDGIQVLGEEGNEIKSCEVDTIRSSWLKGISLSEITNYENGINIVTKLYTYKLPWILNGIAKKLGILELSDKAEIIEELSVLLEVGLPTLKMVKIYQAGIRSRLAAKEIGELFEDELWDKSINYYKQNITLNKEHYKNQVSSTSSNWIELLSVFNKTKKHFIDSIPSFSYDKVNEQTDTLIAKEINGKQYLASPDFVFIQEIDKSDIDFSSINNIPGIFFNYDSQDKIWNINIENPYIHLNS